MAHILKKKPVLNGPKTTSSFSRLFLLTFAAAASGPSKKLDFGDPSILMSKFHSQSALASKDHAALSIYQLHPLPAKSGFHRVHFVYFYRERPF